MDSTQPTLAASSIASWAGGKELTIISQSLSNLFPFFFSTKDVTIGPTAIMAIMTGEVFSGDKEVCDNYFSNTCCSLHIFFWLQPYGIYYAPLLAFFTGVIVFICGNLRYTFSIVLIFNMITVLMIIIIKDN